MHLHIKLYEQVDECGWCKFCAPKETHITPTHHKEVLTIERDIIVNKITACLSDGRVYIRGCVVTQADQDSYRA